MRIMNKEIKIALTLVCLIVATLLPLPVSADGVPCNGVGVEDVVEITVTHPVTGKSAKIKVTCLSKVGATWTYEVEELSVPPDLSHWLLGITTCTDHIISSTPSGAEIGKDGSTGYVGIKWNTSSGFTKGSFTFTLDKDYPPSLNPITVVTKAGPAFGLGYITGPACTPTAIELASFSAAREGSSVSLTWETAVEIDNAGFNLYRMAASGGSLVKINEQLIAATGSGSSYSFTDVIDNGEYSYVLEDVDTNGLATRHVPLATVAQRTFADRIFLPLIGDDN